MNKIKPTHTFVAQYLDIIKEDNIYIFGISNSENNPTEYIIIQISSFIDKQDTELDMEKEYFESSFVDGGYYGVVKNIDIYNNKIVILIQDEDESRTFVCDIGKCKKSATYIYDSLINIQCKTNSTMEIRRLEETI